MKCRLTDRETACAKSCIHARMVMSLTSLQLLFYTAICPNLTHNSSSEYRTCRTGCRGTTDNLHEGPYKDGSEEQCHLGGDQSDGQVQGVHRREEDI